MSDARAYVVRYHFLGVTADGVEKRLTIEMALSPIAGTMADPIDLTDEYGVGGRILFAVECADRSCDWHSGRGIRYRACGRVTETE